MESEGKIHFNKTHDLHMHLNGSFSMEFLSEVAKRNKVEDIYNDLLQTRVLYKKLLMDTTDVDAAPKIIELVWKQFSSIHKIVLTSKDIEEGTIDVIKTSKAKYLEIRTTPKQMENLTWQNYVEAFLKGLAAGKNITKKSAYGLLSINRTKHSLEEATAIVDYVCKEKAKSGLLVGIDISGNADAQRTICGESLEKLLKYALAENIGIAIHIGESQCEAEKNDIDIILKTLSNWHTNNQESDSTKNPLHGKVRLGHAIYLTHEQREQINTLGIPVEVCPSCHSHAKWWNKPQPHPVKQIYKSWKDPVVPGTDNTFLFFSHAKKENRTVISEIFEYPKDESKKSANTHHSKFSFSPNF